MNFVILTTDDAEGKEGEVYADDFYMDNGFYDDEKTAEPSTSSIWITAGFRWRLQEI